MISRLRDGEIGRRGDEPPCSDAGVKHGPPAAKGRESGYALLLIFAMAAAVALMLYAELPRAAFEAQRTREQMLIERGEQYKRAIQLYFRKFNTYPASIEALENTNNMRFLRRRYTDPLTGKEEWRLIHVGPGGVFLDSLTQKPKKDQKPEANQNTFITEGPAIGSTLPDPQQTAAGPRRRASEGGQLQPGSDAGGSAGIAGQLPGISSDPSQQGQAQPGGVQPPVPPFPGMPGANLPNTGGQPGTTGQATGDPSQPAMPGSTPNMPGVDPNQPGMSPADLIGNLLRQPRPIPTAAGGASPGASPVMGTGLRVGGGIAGVASKVEKASIKIYNDHEKYNEWEFIYDYSKDRTGAGRTAAMMGANQQGALPGMAPGTPGAQPGIGGPGGFGGQPGFGAPGGFGSKSPASSSSSSGGVGSGFGSGFGTQAPAAPSQPQPQQPAKPVQQPAPQPPPQPAPQQPAEPGPIPAPPPTPPPDQDATPPQ
jgi:type II secretory pathway pseudopilin PulG